MRSISSYCSNGTCIEVQVWEKSSFSTMNGGCVEAGAWEKSSLSHPNGNCVEAGGFIKSSLSYSNGNCVEAEGAAVRASYCHGGECITAEGMTTSSLSAGNGSCVEAEGAVTSSYSSANSQSVEAKQTAHVVAVRDTKDRSIPPVVFSLSSWQSFIDDVKAGQYPLAHGIRGMLRRIRRCDNYCIGHLVFSRNEWDAFIRGAVNLDENGRGEFDLSPELEAELAA